MSNFQQNNSKMEDLLKRAQSLLKTHVEHNQKLSEDYTNLHQSYSNHIRLKASGTVNCAIELENA